MYLLYVDESGNPEGRDDRYFVLGGVAVFETQAYWINQEVDKLATQFFSNLIRNVPGLSSIEMSPCVCTL